MNKLNIKNNPPIVVLGFNRPNSLWRVLSSLNKADYGDYIGSVNLIISIDKSDDHDTYEVARKFKWNYGEKTLIIRDKRLGMREHSLSCGDFATKYGSIIFLEDDSYVSPVFYRYAVEAINHCIDDNNVAGISLYNFEFNEFTGQLFGKVDDGFDNYYIKSATTWGVCWTSEQWREFREWFNNNGNKEIISSDPMPEVISNWPKTSWKKYINKYLATTKKYYMYPRESLLTNFADPGSHFSGENFNFQSPVLLKKHNWLFSRIENSLAKYDSYFELDVDIYKKMLPEISDINFIPNLYGLKNNKIKENEIQLTIGKSSKSIKNFSCLLKPPEMNIILNLSGEDICIVKTSELIKAPDVELRFFLTQNKNFGILKLFKIMTQLLWGRLNKIVVKN